MSTEILNVVCRERECCGMPDARIHTHICARHTFVHGMGETSKRSAGKACKDTLTTHARTNARTHARTRARADTHNTHERTHKHTRKHTHTHTPLSLTHTMHTRARRTRHRTGGSMDFSGGIGLFGGAGTGAGEARAEGGGRGFMGVPMWQSLTPQTRASV